MPLRLDPLPELFDYLPELSEWSTLREHLHGWTDSALQDRPVLYARKHPLDTRRLALWEVYVGSAAAHFMGAWGLEPLHEAEMRSKALNFVRKAGSSLL